MIMPWRVHPSVGERIKMGRLHLMAVARTLAYSDGSWAWHDALEWRGKTRAGAHGRRLVGEVGKHLITTVTGVIDLGAATAAHIQRLDTVGRMKGGASATTARR